MFDLQIKFLENIFLTLSLIFLILYFLALLIQKKPNWFMSKKLLECKKIQEKYQKLHSSRKDMLHHYYWAKSNKQEQKMKKMRQQVIRTDQQLKDLKQSYERIKKGLPVPLRVMI